MADDKKAEDKAEDKKAVAPEPDAEPKVQMKPKIDPAKAARIEEAQRRIENETVADIGLDRRKAHEHEMAGRQAQEQIDAEAARAEEMKRK